jgi:hypothetical protein
MIMTVLYFTHLFNIGYHGIGYNILFMRFCPNEDRLPSCLRHSFGSIDFLFYKIPNGFISLANSFSIAMCHLMWPFSRKYGTVWYHPASSNPWYLTALSFVNFQEKLTGTSSTLSARAKPACSACCVFGARCPFCVNTLDHPFRKSFNATHFGVVLLSVCSLNATYFALALA